MILSARPKLLFMERDFFSKKFPLEQRTLKFAVSASKFCRKSLFSDRSLEVIGKQLQRSSSSVGANYREANESLSKADFVYRLKISRKEAKESTYWLDIVLELLPNAKDEMIELRSESEQLTKILSAIIKKVTS